MPSRPMSFASAMSDVVSTTDALNEVLYLLCDQLGDSRPDLLVIFATMHHQLEFRRICQELDDSLKPRVMIGCTCSGVIGIRHEQQQGPGLSVLAGVMPGVALQGFSYEQFDWPAIIDAPSAMHDTIDLSNDPRHPTDEPAAIILLADPFSTPMIKLLPTFAAAFGPIPVIGGMASGARAAGQNQLTLNGSVMSEGAVGVAIGGAVDLQTTVSQGCRAVGEPMLITKSHRHIVQELGGKNPLLALRQVATKLSQEDRALIEQNGLHIGRVINEYKSHFGRGDFLIRNMVGVDAEEGYIAIGDPRVRTGQTIQFHLRDAQSAEDDLRMMLDAQQVHGDAKAVLLFSCNGRGVNLFDHPHADAMMVHDALGNVPLAGCFCAGEIGPVGDQSHLHGHTACLAVFRERV